MVERVQLEIFSLGSMLYEKSSFFVILVTVLISSCASQNEDIAGIWIEETTREEITAKLAALFVKYDNITRTEAQGLAEESMAERGYPEGKFIVKMFEFTANNSESGTVRYRNIDRYEQSELLYEGTYTVTNNKINFTITSIMTGAFDSTIKSTIKCTGIIKGKSLAIKEEEMIMETETGIDTLKRSVSYNLVKNNDISWSSGAWTVK